MESLSSNFQYKGLNAPGTDNEDEDFPPEFTTLAHEQEKCKRQIEFFRDLDFSPSQFLIYFSFTF